MSTTGKMVLYPAAALYYTVGAARICHLKTMVLVTLLGNAGKSERTKPRAARRGLENGHEDERGQKRQETAGEADLRRKPSALTGTCGPAGVGG
ncbi:hypothetical protein SKAU_G00186530 [Synaphobranchus kaupii]|uniref:Uncharacterized protein n=1 Tax=Synaphobranchus kaupii TaxID=118154 RepID=A0A9Q1FCU8_SYNKA|nr:hypothetical protein SKAU_G00186530 [Synaphobranchus kaupii]